MYRTLSHAKSLFGNTNLDLFNLKWHLSQIPPSALWCHLSSQFTQLNMYWFESSVLNSLAQVFMHLDKSTASVFFFFALPCWILPYNMHKMCLTCVKKKFAYLSCVDNEAQDWRLWGRVLKLKEWKGGAFVIERKYFWKFYTRFAIFLGISVCKVLFCPSQKCISVSGLPPSLFLDAN